ncbi:MAG: hypothetical protein C0404_14535 [Verrucomicrobia bacterium]|nr:hypothetical protein [Verrucomicrobiota bacterium]
MMNKLLMQLVALGLVGTIASLAADDFPKPYSAPCTERENVFEFTEKPSVKNLGNDRYEISFAVKGNCDVTVGVIDGDGRVAKHIGSGVLGANAPAPFQKGSLKQAVYWNGKDDLDNYIKEPGKMRIRVMLGLKPEFDKLLGDGGPKNLPGYVWGIACDAKGAYVFYKGQGSHGHVGIKKFDRDGNYTGTLVPPPASMPEEKLAGWSYVEYEQGKKALQGPDGHDSFARDGFILPEVNGKKTADCQPGIYGDRLFFSSAGTSVAGTAPSLLYSVLTDGSTELRGLKGLPLFPPGASHPLPRFVTSPDGKWIYMIQIGMGKGNVNQSPPAVFRRAIDGDAMAQVHIGDPKKPGSDNQSFNDPKSLDCDSQGRIYVCDYSNGRLQIFAADGKHLKTVVVDRPHLVRVHAKTGAFYVVHTARVQGQSVGRITKFKSFDDPSEDFHVDNLTAAALALDSWSPKPRLWMAGEISYVDTGGAGGTGPGVTIWEDDGKTLKKFNDFTEDATKAAGANYVGRFSGSSVGPGGKVICDGTREEVYWEHTMLFDIRTGAFKGHVKYPGVYDDTAMDKRGYLHVHLNPGFDNQGVTRYDPGQRTYNSGEKVFYYPEIPYDYGVEIPGCYSPPRKGALPVKDQPGAKFFQDGIGVNMRGDVAVNCNIYYVPKFEDYGKDAAMSSTAIKDMAARGEYNSTIGNKYAEYERKMADWAKRGEEIYSIPRRPGHPLAGATIWTFNNNGELKTQSAGVIGMHIAGVQTDEDGKIYFVTARPKYVGDKAFLAGRTGTFGGSSWGPEKAPFTGTYVKSRDKEVAYLSLNTPIPLEPKPPRPKDVVDGWIEGAEWAYAGASPIVAGGCTCPTMRPHLDWYKRTFISEGYRHSIGVVDSNGNLVMHIGQYGNYDSWHGPKSKVRVGGDEIGLFLPRMISGTDNYLCFQDWGERLAVLKLNYHAEETVLVKAE